MPAKLSIVIAISGLLIVVNPALTSDRYQELHVFKGTDGGNPRAGLIIDTLGNLYGTTNVGGAYGAGTVFELTPDTSGKWTEKLLHSFCPDSKDKCPDGAFPDSSLTFDPAGNLYGTTSGGGDPNHPAGVVFELSPSAQGQWSETVLYRFGSEGDGAYPYGVIFDSKGNLYGTTLYGGDNFQYGTVFELKPDSKGGWTESVLHKFDLKHGAYPLSNLIFDAAGNLYGAAATGGKSTRSCGGCGVAFRLTPIQQGKWSFRVIHFFDGKDGANPAGGLTFDTTGNLYGTTTAGGAYSNCFNGDTCGTVFELLPRNDGRWVGKVLHSFNGTNGSFPTGGVVSDKTGNLYGTTQYGGNLGCTPIGCGTVFKLSPNANGKWVETVLRAFFVSQKNPSSGLTFDNAGNLYGTAYSGGAANSECDLGCGFVFELRP
jgi:uncharacterized repeat protein (TIGR03803 family)